MRKKMSLLLIGGLGLPPTAPARDLADIRNSKRLAVASATTIALPLEADLLGAFARAIGAELRVMPASSRAGALQTLAEGGADVAAGGLISQLDGQPGIAFTAEVFPSRLVAVTRKPAEAVRYLEQMRERRILAAPGSGAAEALTNAKLPSSHIDGSQSVERALASLRSSGESTLVMGLFDALIARRADPDLELGAVLGSRQSVSFAVREKDAGLVSALNGHLHQLRSSPSWRLIIARNLGEDAIQVLARSKLNENP